MVLAESVQTRAALLARAVSPGVMRNNEGKVIQNLERALSTGDVLGAYQSVFDKDFCSIGQIPHEWLDEIRSSLTFGSEFLGNVDLSELYAVRFLCEWATCEFRNCRNSGSIDRKLVFPNDMSRVYMAVYVLCLRLKDTENKKTVQGSKTVDCLARSGPCLEGNKKRKEMAEDQSQTQQQSAALYDKELLLSKALVYSLLNRMKDFNEWAQCLVLDLISKYVPADQNETFDIMNTWHIYEVHGSHSYACFDIMRLASFRLWFSASHPKILSSREGFMPIRHLTRGPLSALILLSVLGRVRNPCSRFIRFRGYFPWFHLFTAVVLLCHTTVGCMEDISSTSG